jgi:hypothetical protein
LEELRALLEPESVSTSNDNNNKSQYGSINKTVLTTALTFAWGISVQALSRNAQCKHQKKVQVSEDPTLSTKQQTDGKIFSMMTINDNNIAQHTQRSKRRECHSRS